MRMPVFCSTVWTSSRPPPVPKAELIFAVVALTGLPLLPGCSGIGTQESRGMLIRVFPLSPTCRIIIESLRLPSVSCPVCRSSCSESVRPWRLSEPTISQLVPLPAAGRPG